MPQGRRFMRPLHCLHAQVCSSCESYGRGSQRIFVAPEARDIRVCAPVCALTSFLNDRRITAVSERT